MYNEGRRGGPQGYSNDDVCGGNSASRGGCEFYITVSRPPRWSGQIDTAKHGTNAPTWYPSLDSSSEDKVSPHGQRPQAPISTLLKRYPCLSIAIPQKIDNYWNALSRYPSRAVGWLKDRNGLILAGSADCCLFSCRQDPKNPQRRDDRMLKMKNSCRRLKGEAVEIAPINIGRFGKGGTISCHFY